MVSKSLKQPKLEHIGHVPLKWTRKVTCHAYPADRTICLSEDLIKLAFDKVAGESNVLDQLQRSVPQKRDRFTPINASLEYKDAFK